MSRQKLGRRLIIKMNPVRFGYFLDTIIKLKNMQYVFRIWLKVSPLKLVWRKKSTGCGSWGSRGIKLSRFQGKRTGLTCLRFKISRLRCWNQCHQFFEALGNFENKAELLKNLSIKFIKFFQVLNWESVSCQNCWFFFCSLLLNRHFW